MSILFRVGQMIMLVMFTLWLLFGAGVSWVAWKAKNDIASSSQISSEGSSSDPDEDRSYRRDSYDEIRREYRREREGVNIEPDSTRPMVDPDPAHRY
jgi:hypothetical protein